MRNKRNFVYYPAFLVLGLVLCLFFFACKNTSKNNGTISGPLTNQQAITDLFKSREGKWMGKKYIYSDPRGQADEAAMPKDIDIKTIISRPTKTESVIGITEEYTTQSDSEQRIKITEREPGKTIYTHHGTHTFKDGKIESRINRLSGLETLMGHLSESTITWQCNRSNPQRIEFFKQIVSAEKIRTIGWGYYEGDDLNKAPRIWYLSDLKKTD